MYVCMYVCMHVSMEATKRHMYSSSYNNIIDPAPPPVPGHFFPDSYGFNMDSSMQKP